MSPLGSVEMSYCSFGGRTAADVVRLVAAISERDDEQASGPDVHSRLSQDRQFRRAAESRRKPSAEANGQLVGVDDALGADKQLADAFDAIELHAGLDAAARLRCRGRR